jgi:hypothetical protein
LLSACSIKNYEQTQTKIIIMKTKLLRFSDLGYIRNSGEAVELELFVAGKSLFKASINTLVCTQDGCMSKSAFNEEYLNAAYPDSILQNILLSSSIYNGENRVQTEDGFEQNIVSSDVDIIYRVSHHETYFKDRKNKILFKIKETK